MTNAVAQCLELAGLTFLPAVDKDSSSEALVLVGRKISKALKRLTQEGDLAGRSESMDKAKQEGGKA